MRCTCCLLLAFTLIGVLQGSDTLDFELKPAGIEQHVEHEAVSIVVYAFDDHCASRNAVIVQHYYSH